MPALDAPLRFRPFLRPMVWGGRALGDQLHKVLPAEGAFGESWDVSDHALHRSVVADGPCANLSLRDLMLSQKTDLLGPAASRHEVFPWLIKFLDCRDWLSVQVHPDTATVKRLRPGEGSKTEAWFILHVEPGGKVYAGLKPGVGPVDMRDAVARGTTHELLHTFTPRPGDCVFLPAGTVHAVGGGVLMAEIQETSDVTFRLFDWNRVGPDGKGRELHIEESFASIHWDAGPVSPITTGDADRRLVDCPFFRLDSRVINSQTNIGGDGMHTLLVVGGRGAWADGRAIEVGQSWVLPAAMTPQSIRAERTLKLLDATLPT